ncbi:membrane associated rhomboid family serine protease [Marmoricola sp. OAE513]|uniref:rhomboid family intramembrane serine protease n=1 Tax=Marmoricola sp. OAE513 TaxID=2817894 RepID=UPI001AE5F990
MNSAAVGFQCPSCVKEGAKQTRTGRLPYGGGVSANPALTTFVLMAINLAVWISIASTGGSGSSVVQKLALLPQGALFQGNDGEIVSVQGVADGAWWQIVTAGFTQVEVWHIAVNMISLYVVGPQIEAILGRTRFLAVYGISLVGSSAAVMLLSDPNSLTVGASGALFGLMGALLVIVLKAKINAGPIINVIGINVVITVVGHGFISWQGHLGGFVVGAAVTAALVYAPKANRTVIQTAGLLGITAVVVALVIFRAAALA